MSDTDTGATQRHPERATHASRTDAIVAWCLLASLVLAAAAYWLPWVDHDTAALKLSGQDLGEFVKFIPEIRRGHLRFPRQLFYLPPFACAVSLVLLSTSRRLPYPRWVRVLMLVLAVLVLPGLLPPAWGHPRELFTPEFRLQGLGVVAGALFVLGHGLFRRLPLRLFAPSILVLALVALVPTQWAFWSIRPRIWAAYGTPTVRLGWGVAIEIVAWASAIACCTVLLWRYRRRSDITQ